MGKVRREDWGGIRILFWRELPHGINVDEKIGDVAKRSPMTGALMRGVWEAVQGLGIVGRDPHDWITDKVDPEMRKRLGEALARGKKLMSYMGFAECRICGCQLGTSDLGGYGFVWPEKAEHYVLEHKVWTPECNELYMAILDEDERE